LWRNRQTKTHLILRVKPRNRRGDFEVQITKPKLPVLRPNPPPPWFWGSTKKPTTGFEAKPGETVATRFEAKLEKTIATGFEAKPEKTVGTGFEAKPEKTVTACFEAKSLETITADFEAKPLETVAASFEAKPPETLTTSFEAKPAKTVWVVLKPNYSQTLILNLKQETHAPRLHVHGADRTRCHLTSRSPGHRVLDLCDNLRPSAPGLLLLPRFSSLHVMLHLPPAHHDTSKRDSPNEIKIKEKQNETDPNSNSNLTKSMTHHNQTKELTNWFLRFTNRTFHTDIFVH
jgi:hypothetical protein